MKECPKALQDESFFYGYGYYGNNLMGYTLHHPRECEVISTYNQQSYSIFRLQ